MEPSLENVPVDPALVESLVCPVTRSPLQLRDNELVAEIGGLRYPISGGIPILLVDQAQLPPGAASLEDVERLVTDRKSDSEGH